MTTRKLLKENNTEDHRWDGWKEELDQWEDKLLKDKRVKAYRTGPESLFVDTVDRSNSWLICRTKDGRTIAINEDQKEFTSPKQLLESIS